MREWYCEYYKITLRCKSSFTAYNVREQSDKLVFCNNVINQFKKAIKELNSDDYKKVVAERDELLRKNKELSRQLKIYEGMRKYFNSEASKLETDK